MHDARLGRSALSISSFAAILLSWACAGTTTRPATLDENAEPADDEAPEVVVASIDPPIPLPGPDLRLARVELARSQEAPLGGFIAVALTGDPAALEYLIRGLGDEETCQDAAIALAFLPRGMAARPLWLALRLECTTEIAQDIARLLDLEHLVSSASSNGELPDPPIDDDEPGDRTMSQEQARCDTLAASLRALSRGEEGAATQLDGLDTAVWELPTSEETLCTEPVIAAAVRLHRGDRGVQLAFDLLLDTPGPLPPHVISFIDRYGLGGVTPRLAARHAEADGAVCAAMVRAGQIDPALETLATAPTGIVECLYPAVRELRDRPGDAPLRALAAIAATATEVGCEAGALMAAIALLERGERPPPWTSDAALLGRALGAVLSRSQDWPSLAELRRLRNAVARLYDRRDPPPLEGPVRLFQRDLRTVLDGASGPRRSALRLLLEVGTR